MTQKELILEMAERSRLTNRVTHAYVKLGRLTAFEYAFHWLFNRQWLRDTQLELRDGLRELRAFEEPHP